VVGIALALHGDSTMAAASKEDRTLHRKIVINGESKDVQHHSQPNGQYANHFKVGHNAFEFVLDFGQNYAQARPAPLHTRIITTPVYAKSLLGLLRESIDQYEQLFGAIPGGDK
jgi:hypothetical protein